MVQMHNYILIADIRIENTNLASEYMPCHQDLQSFPMVTDVQRLNIKIQQEKQHQPSILSIKSLAKKLRFYLDILNNPLVCLAFDALQQGHVNPLQISYLCHDA